MAKLDPSQIEYIDAMNASVRRTATLLRAAAVASSPIDRENLMYIALDIAEAGERVMAKEAESPG